MTIAGTARSNSRGTWRGGGRRRWQSIVERIVAVESVMIIVVLVIVIVIHVTEQRTVALLRVVQIVV